VSAIVFTTALMDLSFVPFPKGFSPPPMPRVYGTLLSDHPDAAFLDAPTAISSGADSASSLACYWQSIHGGRTTAGYSGIPNPHQDDRLYQGSPFSRQRLSDPDYLSEPDASSFGIVANARFDDYTWLFLRAHDLDYLVLHAQELAGVASEAGRQRLLNRLAPALVAREAGILVYDRRRMPPPSGPALVCLDGWRRPSGWLDPRPCQVRATARLAVYVPDAHDLVRLRLDAWALHGSKTVRLLAGDRELARWQLPTSGATACVTGPIALPPGYQELTVTVDDTTSGASQPDEPGIRGGPTIQVRNIEISSWDKAIPGDRPL
jgi:hypothetical protein